MQPTTWTALFLTALMLAGPLAVSATSPRTEEHTYIVGAAPGTATVTIGEDAYSFARIRATLQAGDASVTITIEDDVADHVAGTYRMQRDEFPFEAHGVFCDSVTLPLAHATSLVVAVSDPTETSHRVVDCAPVQATTGTVTLSFT